MKFSKKEIGDLIKSWLVITLIFTIANGFSTESLYVAAFGVGIGFIFHELAHKFTAQKYGLQAYFRSYDKGLLFSFLLSFLGFVFIAPGAVVIPNMTDKVRAGRIAAAGPIMNLILAVIFLGLNFAIPLNIFQFGAYINAFLAAFNLIPFAIFDGKKIRNWNPSFHTGLLITAIVLIFISSL